MKLSILVKKSNASAGIKNKKLINEAKRFYSAINKKHRFNKIEREKLKELFKNRGWKVKHPGAEKFVAIKGNIVAKWKGECICSFRPIYNETKTYEKLIRIGFKKHVPKIYYYDNNIIICERVFHTNIKRKLFNKFNKIIDGDIDLYIGNTGVKNGVLKIIDDIFYLR